MELKFIGRGSAFNPKEGNNSAYFIDNNELFLIDIGENTFEKIIENNILKNIKQINLMITHTHSDHIGSIGTLISYSHYILNNPVNIILPKKAKHLENIQNILDSFGIEKTWYNYITEKRFDNKYLTFEKIRHIETKHTPKLNSYGLIFETQNGIIYYSGDTNETRIIKQIINNQKIDKIYIDTTNLDYENNPHLYIGKIKNVVPDELIEKIYCMHINNDECIKEALENGFNVVETEKVLKKSRWANVPLFYKWHYRKQWKNNKH